MEKKNFNKKILIISSNFYPDISNNLQDGVLNVLKSENVDFELKSINGSLEIPFFLEKYKRQFLGYIIIGCVIKGETPHFDFICNSTFISLLNLSTKSNKPIGNGIITALNMSQAKKRSLIKGKEAANAVLEIIKNPCLKDPSKKK